MVDRLKDLAVKFNTIAADDLYNPLLNNRTEGSLGTPFCKMVDWLQLVAKQADVIAADDIENDILNDCSEGTLGNAFRKMVHFLQVLSEKSSAMANGDLTQEIDSKGNLSDSFNEMTHSMKDLMLQVNNAGLEISSSSSQLKMAAHEQASGASEQSSAISEASVTIKELATTASNIATNADCVADLAEKTLEGVGQINDKVGDAAKRILELGEKTLSIGCMADIIDELAEQTNLLALNAAIEAARAGESGKGFAVVASEVRKLAERSSESTKEIRELINEIQAETNSTIMGIEDSTKWVAKGLDMIRETTSSAKEISLATQQQKHASEQFVQAIDNIGLVTDRFVSSTAESAESSNKLSGLATDLNCAIEKFKTGKDS